MSRVASQVVMLRLCRCAATCRFVAGNACYMFMMRSILPATCRAAGARSPEPVPPADSSQAECRDVTQDDLSSESSLISGPVRSDEAASDPPTEMEEQPDTHEASVAAPEAPEHPSDASGGVSIAAESMDGAAVSNDARDLRRAALLHDAPICLKRSRGD